MSYSSATVRAPSSRCSASSTGFSVTFTTGERKVFDMEPWCPVLHLNQLKNDDGLAWESDSDSETKIDSKSWFELYDDEVVKARNAPAELN